MRLKIVLVFILSVLIPTGLLAFWGLQAVRSEKMMLESSIRRVYESMADVVADEANHALAEKSKDLLRDPVRLEAVLSRQAALFYYQVKILDVNGNPLGGKPAPEMGAPVYFRPLKEFPAYSVAVYEKYPVLINGLEKGESRLTLYYLMIVFSSLLVIGGSFITLGVLSHERKLTEIKSEFVASLSHDLRRPLTSIRMFSEMLKSGTVPTEEKKREYYNIISNQSEQLTDLANNILDFARIERGRKRYEMKPEDITSVVQNAVDRFRSCIAQDAVKIELSAAPDIPPVKIDAEAVSRALTNLMSNAVKYSPSEKEVKVTVAKRHRSVVIEVEDLGIGIPKKDQKKIFEKFYRVQQKETNVEGSGLGLALVKHTVLAHRGKVAVESRMGGGSKFTMALPI